MKQISGIILLNKPIGMSSNRALQKVKRFYQVKKAGHTGSLDPLATGLLPICLNEATKFSRFLLDSDKEYLVTAKLGIVTSTGDMEGEVVKQRVVPKFDKNKVLNILREFTGNITQIPPMYSAIKQNGQPLYKLARRGIEVERSPRAITIFNLELLSFTDDELELKVHSSKGTYIRSLVEDIGESFGCGAYVTCLHRTKVANFVATDMIKLENLPEDPSKIMLPLDSSLAGYPRIKLSESAGYHLMLGQNVAVADMDIPEGSWVALELSDGSFTGVGKILENSVVKPVRLISEYNI